MDCKNKYPIGSQWRTRGGWRAVVVNKNRAWHDRGQNTSCDRMFKNDGCDISGSMFDLMEPWIEKRTGTAWVNVYEDTGPDVHEFPDIADMESKRTGSKRIGRIKVEWNEGQFDV